jgi:outer membrane biosynthesis protein TonB
VERARKKGFAYSIALHLLLLLLIIFGLPSLLKNEPPIEPPTITVELLPITGVTNVKPNDGEITEKPKPEEPKKEPEQKKPAPPVKTTPATTPPPPKPEPAPQKPEPKPEPKKVEKKPDEKKPILKPEAKKEAKVEDLDAILKAVKNTAQKEKKTEKTDDKKDNSSATSKATSSKYDASQPMSLSEIDAIMSQIAKCWSPPAGAKDAQNLVVVIDAEFNVDGSYVKAEIASESRSRYNSDPFFRTAAESALRAVRQCSPIKNLPPEKYETWKNLELHFDPKYLL